MSDDSRQVTGADQRHLIQNTEAMLDYAIIAGAELKNPMLVRFLQLARRALLGQEQSNPKPNHGSPT